MIVSKNPLLLQASLLAIVVYDIEINGMIRSKVKFN